MTKQLGESSSSYMEQLVPWFEQLPQLLHLPTSSHQYAISIVLLTIALRSAITLPVTLWQRKRAKRMVELVAPEWNRLKERLPESVAKRSRRQGLSYEAYEKELKKEVRKKIRNTM
jgi:inner membrane protein COX18